MLDSMVQIFRDKLVIFLARRKSGDSILSSYSIIDIWSSLTLPKSNEKFFPV